MMEPITATEAPAVGVIATAWATAREQKELAVLCRSFGANVVPTMPRSKQPTIPYRHWYDRLQTDDEFRKLTWSSAGGLALVCGAGGVVVIDIDPVKVDGRPVAPVAESVLYELLDGLGLPHDYQWAFRSGSGAGFGLVVICHGPLPGVPDQNVIVMEPRDGRAFGQLEIRRCHCLAKIAGSHEYGPGYRWLRNEPPFLKPAMFG